MNKEKTWVHLRDSFWFLPVIYSLFAILSVSLVTMIDLWMTPSIKENIPAIFLMDNSSAQAMYGALITGILTMTTISFSTIMVVLTTYTTQFSPRTLQDFMRSRVTQHVLGVYSFGIVYVLITLLLLGEEKNKALLSPFITAVVAIICLGFFVLFIHHSSRFVQVNNLIGQIRSSTSKVIHKTYREKDYIERTEWEEEAINHRKRHEKRAIYAQRSGYTQGVMMQPLIKWAKQHNVLLEANFFVGSYVQKGMPLFYYWSEEKTKIKEEWGEGYVWLGNERTDLQDIEFSLQKLVEISVKAISPSINDPHTAINCINRIGSLLAELGEVYEPIRYYADDEDELRIILEPLSYREYLYKSFYQMRIYGKHDISVMTGILEALYKIALVNREAIKKDVWEFGQYIMRSVDDDQLERLDREYYDDQVAKLKQACS
ncbi:DUF2254 domain-containing protein [Halobacillus sp. A1]|uniref:DUF2254 domain-containing protein n=1 Tax=Halobacillus sp. A1 TaxID=2880262 RepID=UPI0020A6A8FE|nr:DUF2254 domain-containing protein [Halobacillus sp. A1]MCP3029881.1 DUF2254 domain-containing protein [Halobacillus sp. A1]